MFVIITYDVSAKRNKNLLKLCRRSLSHVQKSVFEGEVTEGQLEKLKTEIKKVIVPEEDSVAIYKYSYGHKLAKEEIGIYITRDNII